MQHHPARGHLLHRFDGLDAEVVEDHAPQESRSPWRTYRACLERTPPDCTHRLILQDDSLPCPGFREQAERALAVCPNVMVAFFVPESMPGGADAVRAAVREGRPWVDLAAVARSWIPVVALCWPAHMARDMLTWAPRMRDRTTRSDDAHVGRFVKDKLARVWATAPSLVEHPDDTPSLIGNKQGQRKRQAAVFAADGAVGIDFEAC